MKTKYELAIEQLNPTLRPCPFCGGKPYVGRYSGAFQESGSYIGCGECGAKSKSYSWVKYRLFTNKDECVMTDTSPILAANAWNRKPEDIGTFGCPECGVSIPHTHQPVDKYGTSIVDISPNDGLEPSGVKIK